MRKIIFLIVISFFIAESNAQNVGIGTNSPHGWLDVTGAGNTSGTTAFIIKNSSGDTTFRVRDDGRIGISYNGFSFGRTVNISGNGVNFYNTNDAFFEAPLTLPVGSTIQTIYLYVRDQSNTAEVSGELFEYDYSTFTALPVSTITGTGVAAQSGNTIITGLANVTILLGKSYYIRFSTKENAVGLRIFGAAIDYTVTQVD